MQNYGKMVNGSLLLSSEQLDGYKPIEYAAVPEFDETLFYVKQGMIIEYDDRISIGAEIVKVEIQELAVEENPVTTFIESSPWKQTSEIDSLKEQLATVQGALDFIIMNY